jgi:hypothetical protein
MAPAGARSSGLAVAPEAIIPSIPGPQLPLINFSWQISHDQVNAD